MVIGQQMKEKGYDQNNGFYINFSIHLLLKQDLSVTNRVIKLPAYKPANLLKRDFNKSIFLLILLNC